MTPQISSKQLYIRWDAMPAALKEAVASETNSGTIWKIAANEHLSDEKIQTILKLSGYVLMGFIHPEDLAGEIRNNLGIDNRVAVSVADSINKKVFQSVQGELEQVYAAPGQEEKTELEEPVSIDTIKKPFDAIQGKPGAGMPVFPMAQSGPTAAAPEQKGPLSAPFPRPSGASGAAAAKAPAAGDKAPAAPFILHQEPELQPAAPIRTGFKIGLAEEQFKKMEQKWMAPPKPAQIETSAVPKPKPEPKIEERVIHYNNEMRTPIPQAPVPRKAEIAPPPSPPLPAIVPTPRQLSNPFGVFNNNGNGGSPPVNRPDSKLPPLQK